MSVVLGKLATEVASQRSDLLATPVVEALSRWPGIVAEVDSGHEVLVAPINPDLADTAAFVCGLRRECGGFGELRHHHREAGRRGAVCRLPGARHHPG